MRKYKFKLEGPLKLKEFTEENIKNKLAQINSKIFNTETKIQNLLIQMDEIIETQENFLKTDGINPYLKTLGELHMASFESINRERKKLKKLKEEQIIVTGELTKARHQVKIYQNIKDKEKGEFIKEENKRMDKEIEDIVQTRRFFNSINQNLLLIFLMGSFLGLELIASPNRILWGAEKIEHATKKEVGNQEKIIEDEVQKKLTKLSGENVAKLFNDLLKKEEDLNQKQLQIKNQVEQLKFMEAELTKKSKQIEEEQKKLIGCASEIKQNEVDRVDQLVNVISTMKPAKASEILSVQEPEIAVKIFSKLDPAKSSKIFNLMDKEISARLQKMYLDMKK
jgi:flagellar motility protein MotE (MotC chaperone)